MKLVKFLTLCSSLRAAIELLAEGMTLGDAAGLPREALLQYLSLMFPGADGSFPNQHELYISIGATGGPATVSQPHVSRCCATNNTQSSFLHQLLFVRVLPVRRNPGHCTFCKDNDCLQCSEKTIRSAATAWLTTGFVARFRIRNARQLQLMCVMPQLRGLRRPHGGG